MANPTWFVAKDYLANKLAQLQASDPEGNWTVYSMAQAFANEGYEGEEGAYQHFINYGMSEDVSPNALFDVDAYYANKLDALKNDPKTAEEWADKTVNNVKEAFAANGLSAWEHYQQFGTAEGINPSADFDTVKYLEAKAAAMNALGGDKVWTVDDVADAFAENGWSALQHYEMFGKSGAEGEVAENYDPKPVVTLTFAEALAAETLPAEYFLADGAASFEGIAVADLEAAQAKAQAIFEGALNKAELEYSVDYTLTDTLQNLFDNKGFVDGHAYTVTDSAYIFAGDPMTVAAANEAKAAIDAFAKAGGVDLASYQYALNDTLENLVAADADFDMSVTSYTVNGQDFAIGENKTIADIQAAQATVAEVLASDKCTNGSEVTPVYTYTVSDSLANIMAADPTMLEGHTYSLTDGVVDFGNGSVADIAAAQAAAQALIEGSANEVKPELAATYTLADSLANIMAAANADIIAGAGSYTLSDTKADLGEVTVAGVDDAKTAAQAAAKAFIDGAANAKDLGPVTFTFVFNDTVTAINALSGDLKGATGYILTDSVANLKGATNVLFNGADKVIAKGDVAAIDAADAQFVDSLDGIIYHDNFAALQNADRIGNANVSYTLSDALNGHLVVTNVAVADVTTEIADAKVFVAGATNGANFGDATYGYTLLDTIANIKAAPNDVLANAEDANGVNVADTLAAFNNAHDILTNKAYGVDNATATVAGDTIISTATMTAIAAFDTNTGIDITASADSVVTVDASTDKAGATIDLTKFTVTNTDPTKVALTFNATGSASDDTITAHANGGTLVGGEGADTLTGAAGVDVFAYTATTFEALQLEAGDTGDTIVAFTTATDSIQLTKAIEALLTTTGDKINLVANTTGTLAAGDGARLIINDGKLILDQSGDTTATGGTLTDDASDDIVILTGISDLAVADIHFA